MTTEATKRRQQRALAFSTVSKQPRNDYVYEKETGEEGKKKKNEHRGNGSLTCNA